MLSHLFHLHADSVMSGFDAIDKVREKMLDNFDKDTVQINTFRDKNINSNMYKLIIMDINMPVMDGVETTKKIKNLLFENHMNCRVVAHTAMPEDMFRTSAEKWFDDFLGKPLSAEELKTIL